MLSHQNYIPSVWLWVLFLFCLLLFSFLPRRLLFCLTSCLLLNPFSAFVLAVSCSVLSGSFSGMLCRYFFGWFIVPGVPIAYHHRHRSPTDALLYRCSTSCIQLLQWNSFPHFLESSLILVALVSDGTHTQGYLGSSHRASPLWLLLLSSLRVTENPQDGEKSNVVELSLDCHMWNPHLDPYLESCTHP